MRANIKPINILFRNDDPCALSNPAHERRYLEIFAKYGIPQVVSVIPFMSEDPHNARGTKFHALSENKAMVGLLREFSGKGLIEIAQHGTTHQTNQLHPSSPIAALYPPYPGLGSSWLPFVPVHPEKGYSEFGGLDEDFVRQELRRGRDYLNKILEKNITTFTFPWSTPDINTLTALKKEGFKTALCGGRDIYNVRGLMTLYNGREDIFEFAHELSDGRLNGPVLYHVVLHSWMLKDNNLNELDKLLSNLANDKRVGFVTLNSLQQGAADFPMARTADHMVRRLSRVASKHLGTPMRLPQYYRFKIKYYGKELLKSGLVVLIFEKIGLTRFWVISSMLFLLFASLEIARVKGVSLWGLIGLIGSGCVFLGLSVYKVKNWISAGNQGLNKEGRQDYLTVSAKAFRDPQNKPAVAAFFRLFEKLPHPSDEDREKYLQFKYYHSARPWEALNELAQGYARRGLYSLAHMCYAESLLRGPRQEEVFRQIQQVKKLVAVKKLNLSDNTCAISVIVCTNRAPVEFKACLKSILAQVFRDFEIIVLNNRGPNEIQDVIESMADPRIVYKRIDEELGIPKIRNAAVQWAKGRYVAYLDDDDAFYPDHLETLYNAAQRGKYRFVYAKTKGVLGNLKDGIFHAQKTIFNWGDGFDRERFALNSTMGNCAVLHERSLFCDVGLFNDELIVAEEEDFYLRCAAAMDLKHVDKNSSEYRIKDNNSVVVNAIRNHFQGAIVRRFHAAFRGELANLKYHAARGDKREAQKSLDQIRARYLQGWFKSSFVLDELRPLVKYCGDKDLLRMVVSDSSRLYKTEVSMTYGREVMKSGK
ncbi:MAG: hypothetical protein A3C36_02915 [Omnitrophica WOR_2 bacterium RIFCSPHIGHO2_02_FULL_52_10]|nr:MAG: hypothetical protein A3C36_02915 [Omnitrophica WOR_2 bacterium RIFCSPHIGHO2_02_FULL_52_10]